MHTRASFSSNNTSVRSVLERYWSSSFFGKFMDRAEGEVYKLPPQKKRTRPVSSQNGPNKRFSTNLRTAVKAAGEKLSHQCLFI